MPKPIITILLLLCAGGNVRAQQLQHFWTKFIGGDKYDVAYDAVATADGSIVFTGQTRSNGTGDIPLSAFGTDTFVNLIVGKIDVDKNLAWVKVYGGSNDDIGQQICRTSDGGFAVLGVTSSGNGNVTGFRGARDLWLLKLDASGNLMWQRTYGSSNSGCVGVDLIQTRDGGFMLMGTINGAGDDIPVHYGGSPFEQDWFLLKTDASGNKQWAKTLGGSENEEYVGNIIEINDGYYLVGSSESKDYDCIDTAWHPGVDSKYDFYLLKLDQAGGVVWQRSYGGSQNEIPARGILDPRDSSLLLVGSARSTDYMVNKSYINTVTWLIKADKNGNVKWSKILGESDVSHGDGIIVDEHGYIISSRKPVLDIGIYVVDLAGTKIAETTISGAEIETPYNLISYGENYAIVGSSNSTQFTTGVLLSNNNGGEDIFISGFGYWPTTVASTAKNDQVLSIYPNPATGTVQIIIPAANGLKGRLTIQDSKGAVVYKKRTKRDADIIAIETTQWQPGMYMVQWQDDNGETVHAKFIRN